MPAFTRGGGMAMAVGIFVPVVVWNYADRFVWAYLSGAAIIVAFEKGGRPRHRADRGHPDEAVNRP